MTMHLVTWWKCLISLKSSSLILSIDQTEMMSQGGSTKIVNFMTARVEVIMLGYSSCGNLVKYLKKSYAPLLGIHVWQTNWVIISKEFDDPQSL